LKGVILIFCFVVTGCSLNSSRVEYITATAPFPQELIPTTDASVRKPIETVTEYAVASGDTLSAIAAAHNTTVEDLMQVNQITNPNLIEVGQVIKLPPPPEQETPENLLLSDAQFIRGPQSRIFDPEGFIRGQSGYIRTATDKVTTRQADGTALDEIMTAAEVVARVSQEFSVDARVLLALLEYRAGWLTNPVPAPNLLTHPMISEEASGSIDRSGLYRQLAWTANELNRGYYGWKYEGWSILEFEEGPRLRFAQNLNPATVGLQHMLHLVNDYNRWQRDVSVDGFYRVYERLFGDPISNTTDTLVGIGEQPDFTLPFGAGETWFFTGGAHGGWGSGSAWAAVDFAPPDDRKDGVLCYTSAYFARAVASGVIARSGDGVVMLDLDGDADETTGWTVLYLHIASEGRVTEGIRVQTGDRIGRPACEGGFSTATHMHIARRYNGEWLPAYCHACPSDLALQPFTMSGWSVVGLRNQEYQGFMEKAGERRIAEQGRTNPANRVSW
jgi:LasA protease